MVVGDDDQSIYSWRGADLRNILEFEQDYPTAHTVKLEQNYRSVGNVLAAANAVIANNQHRKAKKLFTSAEDGDKIQVYMAADERDEGRWIAGEIEKQRAAGLSYNQVAVFYRTNAQSRMLEDMLLRAGVPYRIVGGTRFFDRAEIRDVMAYLTLVVNPADDIAAKRVINVPRRGIGKTTIERIEQFAREMGMTSWKAPSWPSSTRSCARSARQAIGEFVGLVNEARTYGGDLRKVIEMIIDKSGLIGALQAENTDEARGRIENIQEFLGVVDEFTETHEDEDALYEAPTAEPADAPRSPRPSSADAPAGSFYAFAGANELAAPAEESPVRVLRGDSLADFIEWVRLRTDLDTVAEDGHAVTMMTVHSSKGLEFDCVFVAGMEETLFPHMNSVGDAAGIEEERRLAYVAITRARKKLFLTCAYARQIFGQTSSNPISRFVQEMPLRAAPDHRPRLGRLQRHRLGEARQPQGHRRQRHRGGRRPRVRALERVGPDEPHRRPRRARERLLRAPRRREEGGREDDVRRRRHRGPQDVRPRQGDEGGRRHAVREVLQDRPDQEAPQGLRAHRQDRLARSPHRTRCGLRRFFAVFGSTFVRPLATRCAIPHDERIDDVRSPPIHNPALFVRLARERGSHEDRH